MTSPRTLRDLIIYRNHTRIFIKDKLSGTQNLMLLPTFKLKIIIGGRWGTY